MISFHRCLSMLFACLCCSYTTLPMICCVFTMLTYYGGCGCFVSDKVVCTAVIRVFGRQLAEVPLVATSLEHQGQVSCLGGGASNQLSWFSHLSSWMQTFLHVSSPRTMFLHEDNLKTLPNLTSICGYITCGGVSWCRGIVKHFFYQLRDCLEFCVWIVWYCQQQRVQRVFGLTSLGSVRWLMTRYVYIACM